MLTSIKIVQILFLVGEVTLLQRNIAGKSVVKFFFLKQALGLDIWHEVSTRKQLCVLFFSTYAPEDNIDPPYLVYVKNEPLDRY